MDMNNNDKRKFYLGALACLMAINVAGCKNSECNTKGKHVHMFVTEEGLKKPIEFEHSLPGLEWTPDTVELSKEESELLHFLNKTDLYRINDNLEYIKAREAETEDYFEYSYKNTTFNINGEDSWTTDINNPNLTGNVRLCHHVYQAYKIIKDDSGHYTLEVSESANSIDELVGFDYIASDYFNNVTYTTALDMDETETMLR